MKKIFILFALVLATAAAYAWPNNCHEGIVILAVEHLTPQAKSAVNKYLGESYTDDIKYLYKLEKAGKAKHGEEIHYLHLAKNLKPNAKKKSQNDAYIASTSSWRLSAPTTNTRQRRLPHRCAHLSI